MQKLNKRLESGVRSRESGGSDGGSNNEAVQLRKVEANEGGGYETGRDAALWPFARGCKGSPYNV